MGEIHAHIDIGLKYFVDKMVEANAGLDRAGLVAKLGEVIKLDPTSVFGMDEVNRVAPMMASGKVTQLTAQLRCEVSSGVFKTGSPTIPAAGASTGDQLRAAIDEAIRSLVSVIDLVPNLPPAPAPSVQNPTNAQNTGGVT